jgi:hypothetical protein
MFLILRGSKHRGAELFEVVSTLPDGLTFLCRPMLINEANEVVVWHNDSGCELRSIKAKPEVYEDTDLENQIYFENVVLYADLPDLLTYDWDPTDDIYEVDVNTRRLERQRISEQRAHERSVLLAQKQEV